MKIWYDTEFLERGRGYPTNLISIGMVREDGAELYCINGEFDLDLLTQHPWLMDNVVPYLPIEKVPDARFVRSYRLEWDEEHGDYDDHVWTVDGIARRVKDFVLVDDDPQLWAWYGAYDHVCLAQLFGTMSQMPREIPFYTNDIRQEQVRLGEPILPAQTSTKHHAMADARWNRKAWDYLDTFRPIDLPQ
jgi:hypothetical protein